MKLIFQIAGGIVLAAIIIFIGSTAIGLFAVKSLNESIQQTKIQNQIAIKKAALLKEKSIREQQLRRLQLIEKEKVRNKKIQSELKRKAERQEKIRKAWNKYYEIPYQCKYINSDRIMKWCTNYKINAQKEFNEKVRTGKIKIL